MKFLLFFIVFFFSVLNTFGQDMLVMRKGEQEFQCRIFTVNDSLISYRKWNSPDTTMYTVKKYDVLSFLVEKRSPKSRKYTEFKYDDNYDNNLLGEYLTESIAPGYVITNSNDTLQGFINIKNLAMNQVEINFTDGKGKTTLYSVKDAKGYGYSNLHYEKIKTGFNKEITNNKRTNGYHFLHLAVDGPSKLYRLYTLHFQKSTMVSYNHDPAIYLGKLKRYFIITTPAGKQVFTKGKTLTGSLNRAYSNYPKYLISDPVDSPKASELPGIIHAFNYWYENYR